MKILFNPSCSLVLVWPSELQDLKKRNATQILRSSKWFLQTKVISMIDCAKMGTGKSNFALRALHQTDDVDGIQDGEVDVNEEDDEDLCPVDCVREFKTDDEFNRILEKAKETNALVVVDFYRTSCGSCKYIEQGFTKLCKGAYRQDAVIFLKHNAVPLFHFYKDGVLLEAFPTRDKEKITIAIQKYI